MWIGLWGISTFEKELYFWDQILCYYKWTAIVSEVRPVHMSTEFDSSNFKSTIGIWSVLNEAHSSNLVMATEWCLSLKSQGNLYQVGISDLLEWLLDAFLDFSGSLVPKRIWGNFGNFLPFFQAVFMPKMIVQMLSILLFASVVNYRREIWIQWKSCNFTQNLILKEKSSKNIQGYFTHWLVSYQ